MECYSAIKRNEITSFAATGVDLEIIILSEVNQKERSISHNIICMWNLKKMIQMNLFTRQKQTHRHRKHTYSYQRERGEE